MLWRRHTGVETPAENFKLPPNLSPGFCLLYRVALAKHLFCPHLTANITVIKTGIHPVTQVNCFFKASGSLL